MKCSVSRLKCISITPKWKYGSMQHLSKTFNVESLDRISYGLIKHHLFNNKTLEFRFQRFFTLHSLNHTINNPDNRTENGYFYIQNRTYYLKSSFHHVQFKLIFNILKYADIRRKFN